MSMRTSASCQLGKAQHAHTMRQKTPPSRRRPGSKLGNVNDQENLGPGLRRDDKLEMVPELGRRDLRKRQDSTRFASAGFTLIELMLAITLLAVMMGMIYAALTVGVRAWDTGDARVTEASNWRLTERFLRREFGQVFPTRWRGVPQPNIAFEGTKTSLRYVTSLNLEATLQNGGSGGLQWAEFALMDDGVLQLNRQAFDSAAQNFDALSAPTAEQLRTLSYAPPVRLMDNIAGLEINYFGTESDLVEPTWREEWRDLQRLPYLIRLRIETPRGRDVPELVVPLKVGEEAGCLVAGFTRQCGPRPR
jgi:general secretion pathway protein J